MKTSKTSRVDRNPILNTGLRSLLASLGAYALASLAAAACAVGLPLPRVDAAISGLMLGFALQLLAALWVFAAATVARAAWGLLWPAVLFGLWLGSAQAGAAP